MTAVTAIFNNTYPDRLQLVFDPIYGGPFATLSNLQFDPRDWVVVYNNGKPIRISSYAFDFNQNRYLLYTSENLNGLKPIQVIYHTPPDPFYGTDTNALQIPSFCKIAQVQNQGDIQFLNFYGNPNPVIANQAFSLYWQVQSVPNVRITATSFDSGILPSSQGFVYISTGISSDKDYTIQAYDNSNNPIIYKNSTVTSTITISVSIIS